MPRLWYVRRQGRVHGPFPTGAVVQDRLIGRIGAADELSPEQDEWRPFDAWPELADAVASTPAHPSEGEPQWIGERARARQRWADERGVSDRRTHQEEGQTPSERRNPEQERRSEHRTDAGVRSPLRARTLLGNDRAIVKIVAVLVIAAGLIALLAWLYGPVNPVPVRIR